MVHVVVDPVFHVGPVTGSVGGFHVSGILLDCPHHPCFVINPKLLFSDTSPAAIVIAFKRVSPFAVHPFVHACTESDCSVAIVFVYLTEYVPAAIPTNW